MENKGKSDESHAKKGLIRKVVLIWVVYIAEHHVFSESEEMPMPPLPPVDNTMGAMNSNSMGMMGGGPGFFGGPMGFGPMMGPGGSPEMMNMNQMMMFGAVSSMVHEQMKLFSK